MGLTIPEGWFTIIRISLALLISYIVAIQGFKNRCLWPSLIYMVVACLAPLSFYNPFLPFPALENIRIGEILIIILALGMLVRGRFLIHRKAIILFCILTLLSTITSFIEYLTQDMTSMDLMFNFDGIFLILLPLLTLMAVSNAFMHTWLSTSNQNYERSIMTTLYLVLIIAVALILLGFSSYKYDFFKRLSISGGGPTVQFAGGLGQFVMTALIIAQVLFVHSGSIKLATILALALTILGAGLIATFTRSAWFGWIAGTTVFLVINRQKMKKVVKAIIVGSLIIGAGMCLSQGSLFRDIVMALSPSNTGVYVLSRLVIWQDVIDVVSTNPKYLLIGLGPGNYYLHSNVVEQGIVGTAHNQYLDILCGSGIVGLVAFLLLLVTLWQIAYKLKNELLKTIGLSLLAAFSISSLFGDFLIHEPRNAGLLTFTLTGYFWIVMGLVLGEYFRARIISNIKRR